MRHFCTYFDQHYLIRGLALHLSLSQHCASFELSVLCMDEASYAILKKMNLPNIRLISLRELENHFPELLEAKKNRTFIEYYFTCTPALPRYIFDKTPDLDSITYLDSDLFFFADPAPLYDEIGEHSVGIIEHRFPPTLQDRLECGKYNVGFLFFRRDRIGLACLKRWFEQCVEWCYDRVEGARFADQKYLDDWPERFENVVVLQHKGADLAPWNLSNYSLTFRWGRAYVDSTPLVFYHFHGLRRRGKRLYELNLQGYHVSTPRRILKRIYKPYIKAMSRIARQNTETGRLFLRENVRTNVQEPSRPSETPAPRILRGIWNALAWRIEACQGIFEGKYILVFGGPSLS